MVFVGGQNMKFVVYTTDMYNRDWYLKSKYLRYNWTSDPNKAKKFNTEKEARTMIRELYLNDGGLYKCRCI